MSIAKNARASAVMSKVKGFNPQVFNSRFAGYNEATEGIVAQQMEADRKLRLIQLKKQKATA
mgnify:CR=1|jgi:hypothetical protein|tara:strand:- start:834 stop:1019 length:186 start_codon:yes stop_codon:yes gene_type:complete